MKAKSWKQLVKNKTAGEQEGENFSPAELQTGENRPENDRLVPKLPELPELPTLDTIAGSDNELGRLLTERRQLEEQMSGAVNPFGDQFSERESRMYGGEIPTHGQKRIQEERWRQQREKALNALIRQRTEGSSWQPRKKAEPENEFNRKKTEPDPDSVVPPVNDRRFEQKMKAEKERFASVEEPETGKRNKQGSEEWDAPLPRSRSKPEDPEKRKKDPMMGLEKGYKTLRKTADSLSYAMRSISGKADEFKSKLESMDRQVKEKTGSDTSIMDSDMMKKFDACTGTVKKVADNTEKAAGFLRNNPVKDNWEKLREAKREKLTARQVYERVVRKAMTVDVGSLEELTAAREQLQELAQMKKMLERKEEKKEEQRKEQKQEEKREKRRGKERF